MSVREFVGARYVPIIAGEWDNTHTYEPLMVVTYQGASYTSRQYVPAGIEITNESYWVLSANYNAQVEAYRKEVRDILPYDETPTEGSTKGVTSNGIKKAIDTAEQTNATAIASEVTRATNAEKTNADAIAANTTANAEHAKMLAGTADSGLKALIDKNTTYVNETKKKTVVLLGDSYGEGWTPEGTVNGWCKLVHDFLSIAGYDVHYESIGGVGLNSAKGFDTVLTKLLETDKTLDRNACKLVVIGGCYNDESYNDTDIKAYLSQFRTTLANTFPNARFVLAPFGNTVAYNKYNTVYEAHKRWVWYGPQYGFGVIDGCNAMLPSEVYYSSDGFHPNQNGQYCIAVPIADWIMSGSWANTTYMHNIVSIPITQNSPIYEDGVDKHIEFAYTVGKDKLNIFGGDFNVDIPNNAIPTINNSSILLSDKPNMFLMCYSNVHIPIVIPYTIVANNSSKVFRVMHGNLMILGGKMYLRLGGTLNSNDTNWDNTFNPSHIDANSTASICVDLGTRM